VARGREARVDVGITPGAQSEGAMMPELLPRASRPLSIYPPLLSRTAGIDPLRSLAVGPMNGR
jgi:hypothetical protein